MSRRRSDPTPMGPPHDSDTSMGPPPLPPSAAQSTQDQDHPTDKSRDSQDIGDKYKKLKRRYFELEEKHKDTSTELQRSGVRNVKMREERNVLLDRIIELETQNQPGDAATTSASASSSSSTQPGTVPIAQPSSSALPRTLLNARARTSFFANLRQALAEDDIDDDVDPVLTSRHVGPAARKREEEQRKEQEDGAREAKKGVKRTRSSQQGPGHKGKDSSNASSSQPLLTFAPAHQPSPAAQGEHHPVLVSSAPTKLRIKPPASGSSLSQTLSDTTSPHAESHQPITPSSSHAESSMRKTNSDSLASEDANDHNMDTDLHETRSSRNNKRTFDRMEGEAADGALDVTSSQNFPVRSEGGGFPASSSGHEAAGAPSTASRRENPRPRRSGRASLAAQAESGVEPAPPPRRSTRSTRGETAKSTASSSNHDVDVEMEDRTKETPATSTPTPSLPPPSERSSSPSGSTTAQDHRSTTAVSGDHAPILESIVKVAAAAVAAQNATKPSNGTPDPNLDPALLGPNGTASSSTKTTPPAGNPSTPSSNSATSVKATPSPSPSAATIPAGGVNPYSYYYGTPGTPVTPGTPSFNPYANPYYYLTTPMGSPSNMYAPPPGFTPPPPQRTPSDVQRQAKPKRLKAHTVTSKSFSIPMVPRDRSGKPMLPLNVGIMTVINLGDVCMREHFHTERYIFPVGYEVTRRYLSTIDPNAEVVYHCTILDGGDGPKFQIVPSDVQDRPVIAGTATGAWSSIVKQANGIRNRQHSNSVSGPDFFGLGQNTIKHLIQELPNADRLKDYVWQNFVEGGPLGGRHAAVIPALPEEYDASTPIGAYYPSDRDKLKRESASPSSPRGLAHYPQHIIAQAMKKKAQPGQGSPQPGGEAQQSPPADQASIQPPPSSGQPSSPSPTQGQNMTQIVLPPPTTSETLNIQEYQPPNGGPEKRVTRNSTGGRASWLGQSPTRSTKQSGTRSSPRGHQQQQQQHPPPAIAVQGHTGPHPPSPPMGHSQSTSAAAVASQSTSSVPATFASILNAYPTPPNVTATAEGQHQQNGS